MNTMKKQEQVLIIGGGAAGLLAAKELCNRYTVTLLEARPVLGGRMLAGGAEFVHGKLPCTLELLEASGLSYTEVSGQFFQVNAGQWSKDEDMIEGWDDLLAKMAAVTTDTTMTSFLNTHYPGEKYSLFRGEVKSYVHGFDLADPDIVSVQALYKEWSHEEHHNFRINGGYDALIRFLEKNCNDGGCNIVTNQNVQEVIWEPQSVRITTVEGQEFKAAKLIITTPVSVLQEGAIRFSPALPLYETAAQQIGWGSVIKVILTFKEPFWQKQQEDIGFIFSNETIPTWWTQAPDDKPVLTGWLGGPPAKAYSGYTDEALLQVAIECLSAIFKLGVPELEHLLHNAAIFNWENDPFAKGAYSYDTPASPAARQLLNTPVADTLYFAGEALYNGTHPGTVEAALVTGKNVASKIK